MDRMIGITLKGIYSFPCVQNFLSITFFDRIWRFSPLYGPINSLTQSLCSPIFNRVFNLASELAKQEQSVQDKEIVQLAALLHDIDDWKYSGRYEAQSQ